jgi:hypothetical protein
MNPSDDTQSGPSENGGHPPIHSKKRKTATRGRKKESTRPGGVSTSVNLFERVDQEVDLKSSKYVSTSYAVSKLDEKTDLDEISATQPHTRVLSIRAVGNDKFVRGADEEHHGSSEKSTRSADEGHHGSSERFAEADTSHGNQSSSDRHKDGQFHGDGLRHEAIADEHDSDKEEQNSKDEHQDGQLQGDDSRPEPYAFGVSRDNADQETIEEYSAESRTYHAYYDEVGTSEYTPSELLADNNHSSNVPIFWVTILGAAIIACTSSLNLGSHFGLAFKHCNCFPPCSSLQVESSA